MKKTVKIILFTMILLFLAAGAFTVVNAFTGNPITAWIATAKIKQHVTQHYPTLNLSLTPLEYSFLNSEYVCLAEAKTGTDTRFTIRYSRGRVSDDYAYEVANHFTTYRRLSQNFNKEVTEAIWRICPYQTTMILGDLRGDTQPLTPEAPLDLSNMPLDTSLTVYMPSEARDFKEMATRLLKLHGLLLREGIAIDVYSLVLEEPLPEGSKPGSGNNLYLTDFPAAAITDNMDALQAAIMAHQQAIEEKDKS